MIRLVLTIVALTFAVATAQSAQVSFYQLPSGAYPHDVAPAADGGVFSFSAPFLGGMGGTRLNRPVVGITADPAGRGYRLVAADGGIFSFGAPFYGSLGGTTISGQIRAMSASLDGNGYYLIGSDGALYAFGDAPYLGRVVP